MYPGNDPESGPADRRCRKGHSEAEPCGDCPHFWHENTCSVPGCKCHSSWGEDFGSDTELSPEAREAAEYNDMYPDKD